MTAAVAVLGDREGLAACCFHVRSLMVLFALFIAGNPAGIGNGAASL